MWQVISARITKTLASLAPRMKYVNFMNASLLAYGITFARGIATRAMVSPSEYGHFLNSQLILSYGLYLQLGTFNALNYSIPGSLHRGDLAGIERDVGVVRGYVNLLSAFVVLSIPAVMVFSAEDTKTSLGLVMLALVLSLRNGIGENILRGFQDFPRLSRIVLLREFVSLVVSVTLIYLLNSDGLYLGLVAGVLAALILTWPAASKFRPRMHIGDLGRLITTGLPMFLNGVVATLFIVSAQTVALFRLSGREVGEFSIALMVYGATALVPSIASQIAYPKILVLAASQAPNQALANFYSYTVRYYSVALTLLSVSFLLIFPPLLIWVLPEYRQGLEPAIILALSFSIVGMNGIHGSVVTALGHAKLLTAYSLVALFLSIALSLLLIDWVGMSAIALALLAGLVILFILNTRHLFRRGIVSTAVIRDSVSLFLVAPVPVAALQMVGQYGWALAYGLFAIALLFLVAVRVLPRSGI